MLSCVWQLLRALNSSWIADFGRHSLRFLHSAVRNFRKGRIPASAICDASRASTATSIPHTTNIHDNAHNESQRNLMSDHFCRLEARCRTRSMTWIRLVVWWTTNHERIVSENFAYPECNGPLQASHSSTIAPPLGDSCLADR